MITRKLWMTGALVAGLANPVAAYANDELVRGLIGLGANIILNEAQRQNQDRTYQQPQRTYQQPQRVYRGRAVAEDDVEKAQLRAEVQRRLNALGFDAGYPDGVYGPKTRRAIADFQRSLGRRGDGKISSEEIAILYDRTNGFAGAGGTNAYSTAGAGGAPMPPLVGADGQPMATGGGFPTLGTPGNPASAGGSAFPKIGGAPGTSPDAAAGGGSAFPTIGGAPGTSPDAAAADGSAFPKIGSATPSASGGAFPKLAAPGAAGAAPSADMPALGAPPADGATGFPTLAKGAVEASATPTMPGLSAPPAAAATTMPGMASAPAAAETAMPGMATPPDAAEPAMPQLGAAPASDQAAQSGFVETTLQAEVSKAGFGEDEPAPQVLGIKLGDSKEAVLAALEKEGFAGCAAEPLPIECERGAASLSDKISVWLADDGVRAILRSIDFKQPAPADLVLEQFRSAYPKIMAVPSRLVSSGQFCPADGMTLAQLGQIAESAASGTVDTQSQPEVVSQFALLCPVMFNLRLEGGQEISAASIAFVDMTGVIRTEAQRLAKAAEEEKAKREKLSGDLKL